MTGRASNAFMLQMRLRVTCWSQHRFARRRSIELLRMYSIESGQTAYFTVKLHSWIALEKNTTNLVVHFLTDCEDLITYFPSDNPICYTLLSSCFHTISNCKKFLFVSFIYYPVLSHKRCRFFVQHLISKQRHSTFSKQRQTTPSATRPSHHVTSIDTSQLSAFNLARNVIFEM